MRNRAIFELIYSTGMRAAEALGLDITDVHLEGLVGHRQRERREGERVLPFGEKAGTALSAYYEEAEAQDGRRSVRPSSSTGKGRGFPTGVF